MKKIRAYIIDSHVLVRQTLVNIIRTANGSSFFGSSIGISFEEILNDIQEKNPDLIFLGIDKKDSEEMQLFNYLRDADPSLSIVVITPCNEEGADTAITCLKNGAVEFVTKPERNGRLILAKEHFTKRITPLIKMAGRINVERETDLNSDKTVARLRKNKEYASYFDLITSPVDLAVIGGCTGGVRSLFSLVESLPKQLTVPIIVLQHMPKIYSKVLAKELDKVCSAKVREAKNGNLLWPGHIYVVPGSYHAVVKNEAGQKAISLHRGPREEDARPSLNVLLRSASQVYRDKLLGVFLSGGGSDGILGARDVADKGGQVIIECEESAMLWDLPKQMDDQGISIGSYPVEFLGKEIVTRANNPARKGKSLRRFKQAGNFAVSGQV